MRITIKNNQSKQISTAIGLLDVGAAKTVDVSDSDATDIVSELNKLGSMVTYTIATDYTDTIAASISLYVSATGSDASGDGTAAKPFASIQKAIDVVGDRQVSCNAVINVGPGNFAGISSNLSILSTSTTATSYFVERSTASGGFFGGRQLALTDCYIKGCTAGVTCTEGMYSMIRCGFDSCTKAIVSNQGNNYQLLYTSKVTQNFGFYNNNGTGIELKGPHWYHLKSLSGTGNTIGVSIRFGARLGARSDASISGTTEIDLDATSTTFAAMRAASPRLISSTYGSIVYESDT